MRCAGKDGPDELWRKVVGAVCDSYYHAKQRFDELPPVCQRFVGGPSELRRMGQMDEDTLMTVTRGQFMRRVESLLEWEKVMADTPPEVLRLVQGISDTMRLPGSFDEEG